MNRRTVIVALAVAFLAGAFQASASPEIPLPEVQAPQAAPAPVEPEQQNPGTLPLREPEPIFVDCIDGCIYGFWQCYDGCAGDPWCQNMCGEGRDRCISTCSP